MKKKPSNDLSTPSQTSSEQSPQTSEPSETGTRKSASQSEVRATAKPRNESEALDAVTDLLSGNPQLGGDDQDDEDTARQLDDDCDDKPLFDGADDEGDDDQNDEQETRAIELPETFTPNELAKQLGITPKELYERMQVTLKETGETVTFGEWKDRVQEQFTSAKEYDQKAEQLSQRETELIQKQQLIDLVAERMANQLDPATFREAQAFQAQKTQAESERLYKAVPELREPAKFDAFRTDVVETMQSYGFRPEELVITDHRILLAIKDLIAKNKRLEKLRSFDPERSRKKQEARPAANRPKTKNPIRKAGNDSEAIDAVAGLITGRR